MNKIRRDHPALQFNDALVFHRVDNDEIIAFSKTRNTATQGSGPAGRDVILTIVSLDHLRVQTGWVGLDLEALGLDPARPYVVHDLLTGAKYRWEGTHNFVLLDPTGLAAHLFVVEQEEDPLLTAPPA